MLRVCAVENENETHVYLYQDCLSFLSEPYSQR